jgi:hypothetical protein
MEAPFLIVGRLKIDEKKKKIHEKIIAHRLKRRAHKNDVTNIIFIIL